MVVKKKAENVVISPANEGQRVDNFLISYIKNVPKKHVYKLIRTGQVRINGSRSKPSTKLNINDSVRIPPYTTTESLKPKISSEILKKTIKHIIYEDDELIVFNKPSSFSVHSGSNTGYGLIDIVRTMKKNYERIDLLHRLDKDTSGCIIITKSLKTLKTLQKKLQNNEIQKKYICLVKGNWDKKIKDSKIILSRNKKKYEAITSFKVIDSYKNTTLLEVDLITGRYHQIRKHCANLNFPIIGDSKYGDKYINTEYKKKGLNRIFLHSYSIQFNLGKKNYFKCPLPNELEDFLKKHK